MNKTLVFYLILMKYGLVCYYIRFDKYIGLLPS